MSRSRIKRLIGSAALLFLLAGGALGSGCTQPDVVFVEALQEQWVLIKPYAEAGIRKDDKITQESKALRLRNVTEMTRLINEGLKGVQ